MTQEEFYEDLLGFSDLKITSIEKTDQKIIFHCDVKTKVSTCPNCLEPTGLINQYETRKVQDLKISSREVWLHTQIRQFICPSCNRYFFDTPGWIAPGFRSVFLLSNALYMNFLPLLILPSSPGKAGGRHPYLLPVPGRSPSRPI